MDCQTCNGRRFITVKRREYRNVTTWVSPVSGKALPQREGGVAVRHRLPTGRMNGISEICEDCEGTGLAIDPARNPDCWQCSGRGERNAWDGDEYTVEQCDCVAPVADLEVA